MRVETAYWNLHSQTPKHAQGITSTLTTDPNTGEILSTSLTTNKHGNTVPKGMEEASNERSRENGRWGRRAGLGRVQQLPDFSNH